MDVGAGSDGIYRDAAVDLRGFDGMRDYDDAETDAGVDAAMNPLYARLRH